MKQMYGYARVSTTKQGDGVSLNEQRSAIEKYALANHFTISQWFEEKQTAAKVGRVAFNQMLKQLHNGDVEGVIIHKVDRSARNIQDWAEISSLSDNGIEVHFAHDNVDLTMRSSRLLADIMAVISSDYSRNLSEEALKGIMGRLKQGILPNKAPYGYLDTGSGNLKALDPIKAPLVAEAFKLYATGKYTMNDLRHKLFNKGLTNNNGNMISKTLFAKMLKNPFYAGVIRYKSTEEEFIGKHESLIDMTLFNKVQRQLNCKVVAKKTRNDFLFKTRVHCKHCDRVLTGEKQRSHIYYRCHTKSCKSSVREDDVEAYICKVLEIVQFPSPVANQIKSQLSASLDIVNRNSNKKIQNLDLQMANIKSQLKSLNDKFIADYIDHETFIENKNALTKKTVKLKQQKNKLTTSTVKTSDIVAKFEHTQNALNIYKNGNKDEKRELLEMYFSNIYFEGKKPIIETKKALREYLKSLGVPVCGESRLCSRILREDYMLGHITKFTNNILKTFINKKKL